MAETNGNNSLFSPGHISIKYCSVIYNNKGICFIKELLIHTCYAAANVSLSL